VKAGDAFLIPNEHGIRHLYVVISDPDQNPASVYLVMVSTHETGKDETCILNQGDHPRINHRSVVVYQMPPAVLTSVSRLQTLAENKTIIPQPPVSESVLLKIREGCKTSRYIESRIESLLYNQGLLKYGLSSTKMP